MIYSARTFILSLLIPGRRSEVMSAMTTHPESNDGMTNSRDNVAVASSEKSYGTPDLSNAPSAEREQGVIGDQDTVAGEGNAIVEKQADVPPNGGYGWVCVAACATINACVYSRSIPVSRHNLY